MRFLLTKSTPKYRLRLLKRRRTSILHYLTGKFFSRRLPKNPNYYDLGGTIHVEKFSRLSILLHLAVSDLKFVKSIEVIVEYEASVSPLNFG